jgi:predicted DNA-binding transcriptional regulator AlpA
MPRTIPDDVVESVGQVMNLFMAMAHLAKQRAKRKPSPNGLYLVSIIMDADGNVVGDAGRATVVIPPLTIASIDEKAVYFDHPDQLLSPKHVADLVDVHKATVQRAVSDGELPKPVNISSRRVGHHLAHVQDWITRRQGAARR